MTRHIRHLLEFIKHRGTKSLFYLYDGDCADDKKQKKSTYEWQLAIVHPSMRQNKKLVVSLVFLQS